MNIHEEENGIEEAAIEPEKVSTEESVIDSQPLEEEASSETLPEAEEDTPGALPELDSFRDQLKDIQENILNLSNEFQSKLKYDQHKEQIIDQLHHELQGYKHDLQKKLLQPIIMDIIKIRDDMKKLVQHYRTQETQEFSEMDQNKFLEIMDSFSSDLKDTLYRQRVEPFHCSEKLFNPSLQKAIKKTDTNDVSKDRMVNNAIRSGYEWDGKVLLPELVEVYSYTEKTSDTDKEIKENE